MVKEGKLTEKLIILVNCLLLCTSLIFSQVVVTNKIDSKNKLKEKDVILEKELELGGGLKDGGYKFEFIRSFRVDEAENIYVIDFKARKLLKFDKQGKLAWAQGKFGQGPGEFQLPSGIELGKNDTVLVYDLGNKRIAYYSLNGELLKEYSTAKHPTLTRVDDDSKGFLYGVKYFVDEVNRKASFNRFDQNFDIINEIYRKETDFVPNQVYFYPMVIFFRIRNDDLVLFANSWEYTFYLASGNGEIKKIIRNEYKPVKYTEADKKREFEERYGGRTLPPELKFIFPDYYPPIEHLLIDDQDNIFVRTYERTKDGAHYYDYFDAEGRYIASFPMKETIFCIRGDRFYTLEEDEEGYQKIVRYRYRLKLK